MHHIFGELTRATESTFHFSPPQVVLAVDPETKLEALFTYYVRRQFTTAPAQGDEALRLRVANSLRDFGVERLFKPARVGSSDYSVNLPFVVTDPTDGGSAESKGLEDRSRSIIGVARKAIKPLDLNRSLPSEVLDHGDEWVARVRRLCSIGAQPRELLFTIREAPSGRSKDAAREIRSDLERSGAQTILDTDLEALRDFAQ